MAVRVWLLSSGVSKSKKASQKRKFRVLPSPPPPSPRPQEWRRKKNSVTGGRRESTQYTHCKHQSSQLIRDGARVPEALRGGLYMAPGPCTLYVG